MPPQARRDAPIAGWRDARKHGPILVALSGGLDSIVLLHLLAHAKGARDRGLRALHVHHGLHADADAWAAQCADACEGLGVALVTRRVEVQRDGEGPEAAARRARHGAFAAELHEGETLVLAHHQRDQAETLLLRALRASGPDGLAAMRPWRAYAPGWLWRPLLDTPRDALLAYAQAHALAWCEDPSNGDETLDRNFLRGRVLPLLRERWPAVDAGFAHVAALQADTVELLDALTASDLVSLGGGRETLPVAPLRVLDAARRARVLRRWCSGRGLPPLPSNGIEAIERELLPEDASGEARFAWAGAAIHRWRDALHAVLDPTPLPDGWTCAWDGASPLALPDSGTLALVPAGADLRALRAVAYANAEAREAECDPPWRVHARIGGERIVLPGRTHSHALKHVLQDAGIPPWIRRRMPLVSAGDVLLAAGAAVHSGAFARWLDAHGLVLRWTGSAGFAACGPASADLQ